MCYTYDRKGSSNVFIIIQLNILNIKSSAMAVTISLHTNGYGILKILVNTFYKENTLFRKNNKNQLPRQFMPYSQCDDLNCSPFPVSLLLLLPVPVSVFLPVLSLPPSGPSSPPSHGQTYSHIRNDLGCCLLLETSLMTCIPQLKTISPLSESLLSCCMAI